MYTKDGIDDIENIDIRVFSYKRVTYDIRNYTPETLADATNEFIREHLDDIFYRIKKEIVGVMPYKTFLNLHLNTERDDTKKMFKFASKHNHGFFLDFSDARSHSYVFSNIERGSGDITTIHIFFLRVERGPFYNVMSNKARFHLNKLRIPPFSSPPPSSVGIKRQVVYSI
jgi:hypothetical protein